MFISEGLFSISKGHQEVGLELGYIFPVWRAAKHFKVNIDYTFLGATTYNGSFDNILFADSLKSKITETRFSAAEYEYVFTELGPSFSGLLFKRITLTSFFKIAPAFCVMPNHEVFGYDVTDSNGKHSSSFHVKNTIMFGKSVGGNIRYKFLSLGVKYTWGNKEIETLYYPPGSQTTLNGTAHLEHHTLFFTLGVGFNGKAY